MSRHEPPPDIRDLLNIATGFYVAVRYEMPFIGVCLIFALTMLRVWPEVMNEIDDESAARSEAGPNG